MDQETKVCTKCGVEKQLNEFVKQAACRDGLHPRCKSCCNEYQKQYLKTNKEKIRQRRRKYYQPKRKEQHSNEGLPLRTCAKCGIVKLLNDFNKDKSRKYGVKHVCKSCCKEYRIQYYIKKKEQLAKKSAQYRILHIELMRERFKKWYISNKEKSRENCRNRRARKINAPGKNTASDIKQLMTLQKSKCAVCRCSIKNGYHVDHIVPLAKGGSNDKFNLQLLCQPCNQSKHAKDPIYFMQQRGFLL